MKAGWEQASIGAHCRFENGDRGKNYPGRKAFVPTGVPFVNAGHLGEGVLDLSQMNYIPRDHFERLGSGKIQIGDLLFCLRGSLGKYAVVDNLDEGAIASSLVIVRPTEKLSPRYLGYYFGSPLCSDEITKYANGAAQPNLSAKSLAAFKVPLPALEEQQRIVAVLDEAFDGLARARAHAEANLQNARELFESHLVDLFTHPDPSWKRAQLSDYCEKITVGHVGPMAKRYVSTGTPFLRSQNVRPFKIDLTDVKYIDEGFTKELGKSELRPGDVAIVRTGYPGTCAVIPDDLELANCSDLVIARTGPKLNPNFLALLLNSAYGKELVAGASVGAAQKHFNVGAAKKAMFPFPPLSDQELLVVQADKISTACNRLASIAEKKLQDLDDLRQSLLQKAFAGELTSS